MARIRGTKKRDILRGTDRSDTIFGLDGKDTLFGRDGNDRLFGGLGNDRLFGQGGNDILNGDNGRDVLNGGAGNDRLSGGLAQDRLKGGAGNDRLDGGAGRDVLNGGSGNDTYLIDTRQDRIVDSGGKDKVRAEFGRDTVKYSLAKGIEDLIVVEFTSPSTFRGNGLSNKIEIKDGGSSKLFGLGGNDILRSSRGFDSEDFLDGGRGKDRMFGFDDDDTYIVDNKGDRVFETESNGFNDLIESSVSYTLPNHVEILHLTGSANRRANGNSDDNELRGNSGDNVIFGGLGNDRMNGGGGADRFLYTNINQSSTNPGSSFTDLISGFSSGQGDRIDLRPIDANPNTATNDAFVFLTEQRADFTAPGQVRFDILPSGTTIEINTDADDRMEMGIRILDGGTPDASWFLL